MAVRFPGLSTQLEWGGFFRYAFTWLITTETMDLA